jgi:hypothetical protein
VSWNAQPAQAGPTPFGISIPFTTPFLYDPMAGDLNVECDLPIQTFTGSGPQLDVEAGPTTSLASRVYMSTGYPNGATTVWNDHAVVIEVTYVPAAGYALATPFGTGCIDVPDVSSYELFATAAGFDLANSGISMLRTPTGYTALPLIVAYVPPTAAATSLALGDDTETTVTLASPMPYGANGSTTQLTVCSNGFVSPAAGNGTAFTPSAATFLNGLRMWWSAAWHDFNPAIPGSGPVKFEQAGGFAYVTWDGVWDYGGTSAANASTFQVQFDLTNGHVHYVYLSMSAAGGTGFLTGVSDAGPSADPGSMDISAALPSSYTASVFAVTPLAHAASARPVLGTTISLDTSNVPVGGLIGLTILGLTEHTAGIDLTFLGMPTCSLYASLDLTLSFLPVGGAGATSLPIPNNPALATQSIATQGAVFVPGINTFGFVVSNGVRLKFDVQ